MFLKIFFKKNLLLVIIIFPLIIILFYGVIISTALKYKHEIYTTKELERYEHELKNQHKKFLREKAKYIESFMHFIYSQERNSEVPISTKDIWTFIDFINKYDSGFVFVFNKKGDVIKHPCAKTLINLVQSNKQVTTLSKLINAGYKHNIVYYSGTDCINHSSVKKLAYVHHIKTTDLFIVISKNEKDIFYSISEKKKIWQEKLDDESNQNIKLLIILSMVSIIVSILFSKFIQSLFEEYEKEINENNIVMFSQSRLAQVGELLSMIAHQWRQPISKIASISSNLRFKMIRGDEFSEEYLDERLEEIENHTEFLSETIDDFREFYKPKKSQELEYVLPLIEKSLNFLEGQLKKKSMILKKKFESDVKIPLYSNELIQVMINIIQNAIDFSATGASIWIETQIKNDEYIIRIKDEAGGIKEENLDKIFEAHFSTKLLNVKSTNLGLGLYVSKVIVEKHFNGKLEVITENNSSTFIIRLLR